MIRGVSTEIFKQYLVLRHPISFIKSETDKPVKLTTMNGTGKGMKMGGGRGLGRGGGQGRNKGGSFGTGGYCVCAKCGEKVPHEQGVKCTQIKCPKCGKPMIREELLRSSK